MKKQINPENIQTVGELIEFLENTKLFCRKEKKEAIKFFSEFDKNELIDNIDIIPGKWVVHFCKEIKGKTIDRFRNRINDEYHAFLWAYELGGKEIELMRSKINSAYSAFWWAGNFRGKEIELMRSKITDDLYAFLWACEFKGAEIDYMINIIKDNEYKNALIKLKQNDPF